ncbi:MAG: murein biosynthesis integral membrane protein MurJ [Acidobacteria bacterium]|nr:murein biosynthesis integral membrane protein MurJ [Acidobacteriota bacterium]
MSRTRGAVRAAGTVSLATLVSRISGLVRDQVFAALFGAGMYMDAFNVAFLIPNLLRDLFAEGALSAAFVPTFTKYLSSRSRQEAWELASLVINALLVILSLFTLLILLLAKYFVLLFAYGFTQTPGKVELTATLTRIMSPFLMMVALAAVAMGVLNATGRYFVPAVAPAFFNIGNILAGILLVPVFTGYGKEGILAMAVGSLVGGAGQFLIQVPLLRRQGFRYRLKLSFSHPGLRQIGRLMLPATIGLAAVQINLVVNRQLAASLPGDGPVSWLSYAFRLIYLPIGLFGVAIATVNLRETSLDAARNDLDSLRRTLADSLKMVMVLTIPSTFGLAILSQPIIQMLYQRGRFTEADTTATAHALIAYSLGLFAYSCVKTLVPTFYALNDTRTPMRISLIAVLLNIIFNLALVRPLGYIGLALGTSLTAWINVALLSRAFYRKLGSFESRERLLSTFLRCTLASVGMSAVVLAAYRAVPSSWTGRSLALALVLAGMISLGCCVYALLCVKLRVSELEVLWKALRARLPLTWAGDE